MKVKILLSSYNGEQYIREQIDSLLSQTQTGVEILVRDDGSTDSTKAILDEYQDRDRLSWYGGKNLGPGLSFWKLLEDSGEADYYAFCDQDDVWDQDKVEIAVRTLEEEIPDINSIPALYCGDVRVVDKDLNPMADHMMVQIPTDYPHALIRSIAPGCTFVFNRQARDLLCRFDAKKYGVGLFDWTAYQIIACFGRVIFDPRGHMSYRQHGDNAIGAVTDFYRERLRKIKKFWSGDKKNSRQQNALRLGRAFGREMSPENRRITRDFARYKKDPRCKLRLLKDKSTYYPGSEYLLFKLLILFNRL